jgi:hypothetical protein
MSGESDEDIIEITFSDNNNTFSITNSHEDNGQVITEISIYKRK